MHSHKLSHNISITLELRYPHIIRLLKLNLSHPFKISIETNPFVWRRGHNSFVFLSPISHAPALAFFFIFPHTETKAQINHTNSLRCVFITCCGCRGSGLTGLESFCVSAYTLVLGVKRYIVSLMFTFYVKHMLIRCAICFMNANSHLAFPKRDGIGCQCILRLCLGIEMCGRFLVHMHFNQ